MDRRRTIGAVMPVSGNLCPRSGEIHDMSRLRFKISISLDGFVAGPSQSLENPLGIGGTRLHEWAFALAVVRAQHGLDGGEVNESTPIVEESLANIGATVIGRVRNA